METIAGRDPQRIRRMFGGIAPRYDLLNHLLSGNLDRLWRRRAASELAGMPVAGTVLDLCAGTGDLSLELLRQGRARQVVCCDFCHAMLERAGGKARRKALEARCWLVEADGLRLPFDRGAFDAVTVAFGVRNLADLEAGLREMHRVLKRGGRLVVLEFSQPQTGWLARCYRLYLHHVLPRLAGSFSNKKAYAYLAESISLFPEPQGLARRIREAGFPDCRFQALSGGIVAIHTADRS